MGSPMRLRRAAVLAALACLLPALAACGGSGTQVQAGDVVQARQAKQFEHGRLSTIATPIGALKIRAGKEVTQLAADDTHELTAQTAPSGLTYLPITWSYAKGTTDVYSRYVGTNILPTVDVRSGDGTYRLPSPDPAQGAESFYVLVAASSEHPRLEVTFDGVTQSADLVTGRRDTGRRARGLYQLSYRIPRATDCPDKPTWVETATAAATCKVTAPLRLPYAAGRWAKPGHSWLVVDVRTTLATYTQAGTNLFSGGIYYPQGVSTTYRLGERKPVSVLGANDDSALCPVGATGGCNSHAAVIFDAKSPHATLTLLQRYKLTLGNGWGGYDGKKHESELGTTVIPLAAPA